MLRLLHFSFNGDIHWFFFNYKHQSQPYSLVLVAIFEKVKISKFSKTPINFKIYKKSKKKSENFKLSTFKIFKEKN
jgi:hypothetical protein